jgi:hypothetical protein
MVGICGDGNDMLGRIPLCRSEQDRIGKVNYVGGSLICRTGREMLRWSCAGQCLICHSAGWKLDMSVCRDMLRWKLYAGQCLIFRSAKDMLAEWKLDIN